jgi:hypothetical protein
VDRLDDPAARSAVFQLEFGKSWRIWAWAQRQFSATSLGIFGVLLAACGTYIVHLRENVVEVRTRVVVLEKQVIPVIQDESIVTTLKANVAAHEQRLGRLEQDYDVAYQESLKPPVPRKRVK